MRNIDFLWYILLFIFWFVTYLGWDKINSSGNKNKLKNSWKLNWWIKKVVRHAWVTSGSDLEKGSQGLLRILIKKMGTMYDSKISSQKQKNIYNIKHFVLTSVMAFFHLYRNSLLKILKFCEKSYFPFYLYLILRSLLLSCNFFIYFYFLNF